MGIQVLNDDEMAARCTKYPPRFCRIREKGPTRRTPPPRRSSRCIFQYGVSPDSKSFSDDDMGPIPSKWKGICQNENDKSFQCNSYQDLDAPEDEVTVIDYRSI